MTFLATAPGQMMVAGEYTVVQRGGACLAVAVDPGVEVSFEPGDGPYRVTAPELGLFEVAPAAVPLIENVLQGAPNLPKGGAIHIRSALGSGKTKPGLGASAAITTALLAALRSSQGAPPPTVAESVSLHQRVQGGLGSGYDAATSLLGGVIVFRNTGRTPEASNVSWPAGLHAAAVSTGTGSSSRELLGKMNAWRSGHRHARHAHDGRMLTAAQALIQSWSTAPVGPILNALADCQEALEALERDARVGLFDHRLGELLSRIEESGAVGRVSGAGGGDSAWIFSEDPNRLKHALTCVTALGFRHLPVYFPAHGLQLPHQEDTPC